MSKQVILTGLRSNSELHIGNYLGAILPMVKLQKDHGSDSQINMFIPDLHSFTTPVNHSQLYKQTIANVKIYIASGLDIDNENTYIYRQSYISAHSELAWILSCFTYMGELSRMTQYKEKSDENASAGLFNYPVLMAADILLYDAQWVPLGDDQRQHLELTRDLAIRFNNKFGDTFTVPFEWNKQMGLIERDQGVRIRSLRNPAKKMSKSIQDPSGTIMLSDAAEDAAKKVMGAETDSYGIIKLDWDNQPGISNLLQILSLLENKSLASVAEEWSGKTSYGDLKKAVASAVKEFLTKLQSSLESITDEIVLDKLIKDEAKMQETASHKLFKVQKAVGLRA
jgi:tryptophanyl-tRNA synthetase